MKPLRVLATFCVAILLGGCATSAIAPSFESQVRAEAGPTVRLMAGANGSCSAVVVAPGLAMTALHCEQAFEPKVDGHAVSRWIKFSQKDAALVVVPGLTCPCATLVAEPAFEAGERVAAIGFPHGVGSLISYGEAQDFVLYEGETYLHHSAPVVGGMSGGGVFVVREGRTWLLAITSRGSGTSSLAVPASGLPFNLALKE